MIQYYHLQGRTWEKKEGLSLHHRRQHLLQRRSARLNWLHSVLSLLSLASSVWWKFKKRRKKKKKLEAVPKLLIDWAFSWTLRLCMAWTSSKYLRQPSAVMGRRRSTKSSAAFLKSIITPTTGLMAPPLTSSLSACSLCSTLGQPIIVVSIRDDNSQLDIFLRRERWRHIRE